MSGTNQITFTDKVNTRSLPIPSINKVRDVDLNEIKQEHNALDNIVTDPVTGLVKVVEDLETNKLNASVLVTDFSDPNNEDVPSTKAVDDFLTAEVPEPNENQILIDDSGIATIKSILDRPSTTVINFLTSATIGSPVLPIYDTFSFNESSLIDSNRFNKWIFYFSCNTEPTVTSSPASYVVKTGTILTGYANLNEITIELKYNTSGILKAYMNIVQMASANLDPDPPLSVTETSGFNLLFDVNRNYGNSTLPRYLEMTGSLAGAVDGVVTTMTHSSLLVPKFLVDSGVEAWGTKPAWLTVSGDPYLVGEDNINNLVFTHSAGAVTCVNTSVESGNADPNRVVTLRSLIKFDFNDFASPVLAGSVISKSIYSEFAPTIINPSTADFKDLGDGNYALEMGYPAGSSQASGDRARMEMTQIPYYAPLWANERLSIIWIFSMVASGTYSSRVALSNQDSSTFAGFSFQANSLTGMRMSIGNGSSFQAMNSSAITLLENDSRYALMATFENDGTNRTVKFYWMSPDNSVAFTTLNTTSTTNVRNVLSQTLIHLSRTDSSSALRPEAKDYLEVRNYVMSAAELEAVVTPLLS